MWPPWRLLVALYEHRNNAKGHIGDGSGKSDNSVPDMELVPKGGAFLEDNSISSAEVESPGIAGALDCRSQQN